MQFSTPQYIYLFLPVVVAGYYMFCSAGKKHCARVWVVLANLMFYGIWSFQSLPVLIGSVFFNFYMGQSIERYPAKAKWLAMIAVAGNLLNLGVFKYLNPLLLSASYVFDADFALYSIFFPLGISFFTFQQISYILDSRKGLTKEYSFLNYALFVTFFPQLVAGPIVHHKDMMPQFADDSNLAVDWKNLAMGIILFAIGLFKKAVLADSLSPYVDAVFAKVVTANFFSAWLASVGYTLQLYFDFSAYSEMAIGAALMFNVNLPINFDSPLQASNIVRLWNAWHITMTDWFKNYLYMPISAHAFRKASPKLLKLGMSYSAINTLLSIATNLVVFAVIGLWHEGSVSSILFGVFNGVSICLYLLWSRMKIRLPKVLGVVLTFLSFLGSCIFFRAKTWHDGVVLISKMFDFELPYLVMMRHSSELYMSRMPPRLFGGDFMFQLCLTFLLLVIVFTMPNSLAISGYLAKLQGKQAKIKILGLNVSRYAFIIATGLAVVSAIAGTVMIFIVKEVPFIYLGF